MACTVTARLNERDSSLTVILIAITPIQHVSGFTYYYQVKPSHVHTVGLASK